MQPLRILFLSAEVAPFAKAGGLADVVGALPEALAALGHDVRIVMPAYQGVEQALQAGKWGLKVHPAKLKVPLGLGIGAVPAGVLETTLPGTTVPVYFIAEGFHFGNRPNYYGYQDDPYRFAFFSRAALELVIGALMWRPDVVHAHDWHAAPAVAWLATAGQTDGRFAAMPTVYTIHNLMHQGNAPWPILDYLGVISHGLNEERYGEVNFMARGIYHATMITSVSPTYTREIVERTGGCGLDGLLRYRHFDLHGILNGLDTEVWDPATDKHLAAMFDADTIDLRRVNKEALQKRAGLPIRPDVPICAMVTRLDAQKGLSIAGHVLHRLMNNHAGEAQCIILGSGAPFYENMLRHIASYHKDKMAVFLKYDAELAPLIYGGSDIFLMPSLFEPCGLGQMIAMRYGSVPVVRATGGLADTVRGSVTGFTFANYASDDFWNSLQEALFIYHHDPESWRLLQKKGMRSDFSWETSARAYKQVYDWAMARLRGW